MPQLDDELNYLILDLIFVYNNLSFNNMVNDAYDTFTKPSDKAALAQEIQAFISVEAIYNGASSCYTVLFHQPKSNLSQNEFSLSKREFVSLSGDTKFLRGNALAWPSSFWLFGRMGADSGWERTCMACVTGSLRITRPWECNFLYVHMGAA